MEDWTGGGCHWGVRPCCGQPTEASAGRGWRCGPPLFPGPYGFSQRPKSKGGRVLRFPTFVFRYSHSAHVMAGRLLLVGGVWLHPDGVPGVAVIDLAARSSLEFRLDTVRHVHRRGLRLGVFNEGLTDESLPAPELGALAPDAPLVLLRADGPRRSGAAPGGWGRKLFLLWDSLQPSAGHCGPQSCSLNFYEAVKAFIWLPRFNDDASICTPPPPLPPHTHSQFSRTISYFYRYHLLILTNSFSSHPIRWRSRGGAL